MLTKQEVRDYVDEYAALAVEAEGIKKRMEYLKGVFEQLALDKLKDTKLQSTEFWGAANSRVTVTTSATVKLMSATVLRKVLGDVAADFIKTKTTEELTEPCKRLLASVVQGEYLKNTSLATAVMGITQDEKQLATLMKKLKGSYAKDKATLMSVVGLDEQTASDAAYIIAEVVNWERLLKVLQAAGWAGTTQEAIETIKAATIVEDGIKVAVTAEPPAV